MMSKNNLINKYMEIKLEPKKGRYDNDWKISVNNIFAVAEQCNRTDTLKLARKELREYIEGLKITFEKEAERVNNPRLKAVGFIRQN